MHIFADWGFPGLPLWIFLFTLGLRAFMVAPAAAAAAIAPSITVAFWLTSLPAKRLFSSKKNATAIEPRVTEMSERCADIVFGQADRPTSIAPPEYAIATAPANRKRSATLGSEPSGVVPGAAIRKAPPAAEASGSRKKNNNWLTATTAAARMTARKASMDSKATKITGTEMPVK